MIFTTTPHPEGAPAEHQESALDIDKAFYRAILHEMMNTGIGLTRTLELAAVNAVANGDAPLMDVPLAFERIARAIRRSIMLAMVLNEPAQTPAPPAAAPSPAVPSPISLDHDRPERPGEAAPPGAHPGATASETAEPGAPESPERPETLAAEAPTHRPIAEQIAAIRRDLGLPQDSVPPPPITPPASGGAPAPSPAHPPTRWPPPPAAPPEPTQPTTPPRIPRRPP